MKHPKHTLLTHFRTAAPDEIEALDMFDDRDLASLAGKVEHKDDWEALLGTLDRWRDRT
jgi:hypothetical protein